MDTLGASTGDLEKGGFNASLQVRFEYLFFLRDGMLTSWMVGYAYGELFGEFGEGAGRGVVEVGTHYVIVNDVGEDLKSKCDVLLVCEI